MRIIFFFSSFGLKLGSYAVSDKAPLAAILQRDDAAKKAIDTLLGDFTQVDLAAAHASCTKSYIRNLHFDDIKVRWPERRSEQAGCVSDLELQNHGSKVWPAMNTILRVVNDSSTRILKETNASWSRLYTRDAFQRFSDENCFIQQVLGLRVNRVWYLRLRVTATAPEKYGKRSYISEYVTRGTMNGSLISIERPVNDTTGKIMPRATTLLTVKPASRNVFNVAEGPKGRQLLFHHNRWHKFAGETLLGSNIGGLALPLLPTLLPLPLFTETNTFLLILYSLLTDVCNMLPLAFKGGELLIFAKNLPRSAQSETYSLDAPGEIGALQTWVLGCGKTKDLSFYGMILIIVALLTTGLGIFLEVHTYRKLIYLKEEKLNDGATTNSALMELWRQERRCIQCSCHGDIYNEHEWLQWSRRRLERRSRSSVRYEPGGYSLFRHGDK